MPVASVLEPPVAPESPVVVDERAESTIRTLNTLFDELAFATDEDGEDDE
ncbi:MAG: hypothetical protein AAF532_16630 [Planctomycetota bacterium]